MLPRQRMSRRTPLTQLAMPERRKPLRQKILILKGNGNRISYLNA